MQHDRGPLLHRALLKRLRGEERLRLAFQLYQRVRKVPEASARAQYPDLPAEEIRKKTIERLQWTNKRKS